MDTNTKQPDHHACLCDEEATQLPSSFLRLFCFCVYACILTDQQQQNASVKSARTSASNNRHAGNLTQQIATSSSSYAPMSRYLSNRIPLLHTAYPDPCQLLSHQLREVQVPVLTTVICFLANGSRLTVCQPLGLHQIPHSPFSTRQVGSSVNTSQYIEVEGEGRPILTRKCPERSYIRKHPIHCGAAGVEWRLATS